MATLQARLDDLEAAMQQPDDGDRVVVFQARLDSAIDPASRWTYELLIKNGEIPFYEFGCGYGVDYVERMCREGYPLAVLDRVMARALPWLLWCAWRDFIDRTDAPTLRAYRGACRGGDRADVAAALLASAPNELRAAVENSPVLTDATAAAIDRQFAKRNPYYQIYRSTWND